MNLPWCTVFISDALPTPLFTAFIQKSTSSITLHSCPHRSFYTRHSSLFMGQKKSLQIQIMDRDIGEYFGERWERGALAIFWKNNILCHTHWAKNPKQSHEKILITSRELHPRPARISTVNILHFCPSRSS